MSCSAKDSSRLNIKAPAEQPTSASLSSVHTTRSPLSPIDLRRNSASSQVNTLTSELSRSISSDINSSAMREGSRQTASRGESRSNRTNNQNHAPNDFASMTPQPQGNHHHTGSNVLDGDMYIHNSLNSFSFGPQTPSNMNTSRPGDPVPPHESDSRSEEFSANDTPRPSVVAQPQRENTPDFIRSHPAQDTQSTLYHQTSPTPMSPGGKHRVVKHRDRKNASVSPAASSTSLSSRSGPMSRADSRTSYNTNTTNQTSAQDYSSNDDDDMYRNSPSTTDEALSSTLGELSVRDLTSEDEYGGSEFEDEVYSDEDVVEIGSVHYEGGSSVSHEWERALYSGGTSGSGHLTIPGSARRGSLPSGMNVPIDPQDSFSSGRLREDSLATLRRPSRSLDDEIHQIRRDRLESPHGIYDLDDPLSRPGVPSPASVPQSDSDWQRLESRSSTSGSYKGKEVDRKRQPSIQFEGARPYVSNGSSSHSATPQEFDDDWMGMKGGITFLNTDEMADIVAPMDGRSAERKSSLSTLRFFNFFGNNRRPSAATISTIHGDSFGRAIRKWDKNSGEWAFKKERAESGSVVPPGAYSPRASVSGDRTESLTSELTVARLEKHNAPFKGMNLGSVELWRNELVGRFKVDRKETKPSDSAKGPQQRLIITSIPDPYIQNTDPLRGPPVTVHKHSKATAFSISRHYRWENRDNETGHNLAVPHGHKSRVLVPTNKKSSSMILLAPRRVQEAFTNTNTTRRLEYHGLLDDKEQEKRRQKARERESRRGRRREESSNNRSRPSERSRDDSVVGTETMSSSFSGATLIAPPASAPAPQLHTYPPSHPSTSSEASTSRDSGLERMSSHSSFASARRRRKINDPYNFDTDEDDVGDDFSISRTPYTEVYSTVDSTSFEQQARPDNESSDSIFSRLVLRRNQHNYVLGTNTERDVVYKPPWMTMAPRTKQEEQQRVVENLNTSFKDVGLLPSSHKERSKPGSSSRKSKKVSGRGNEKVDIFKEVPPDVLYMLLPLWPGETDHKSREEQPFEKPVIPSKDRQYLMIYYKPFESSSADERKKGESESKKRSRGSQNSSHDSTLSQRDKAHILLPSFHITCRVVSYADLQGSGVRVPDDGLAVTGPLDQAFAKAGPVRGDNAEGEWAIGACHSREAGVEFYPDTFWRMNLAIRYNEPDRGPLISEEEEYPEGDIELTPLGRAVMEMAWVGGMALASFG